MKVHCSNDECDSKRFFRLVYVYEIFNQDEELIDKEEHPSDEYEYRCSKCGFDAYIVED